MLSVDARGRLVVVLVGARNPQNIGAVARAMHDFGFSDLRVVNEFTPPFEAAQLEATSAVNAGQVMRSARLFSNLPDALADCSFVAGTTAIGERELRQPIVTLQEAAPTLRDELSHVGMSTNGEIPNSEAANASVSKVALLFGSEKTGLTRQELSFCSLLLTIPMFAPEGRHLSMNLGQSVAVCLYELTRGGFEGSRPLQDLPLRRPTADDQERLLTLVLDAMEHSGYTRRFPANARPEVVRQLARHLGHSYDEATTWMGFFRQLLRVLPQNSQVDEKANKTP